MWLFEREADAAREPVTDLPPLSPGTNVERNVKDDVRVAIDPGTCTVE
jgi:hypothetical protein